MRLRSMIKVLIKLNDNRTRVYWHGVNDPYLCGDPHFVPEADGNMDTLYPIDRALIDKMEAKSLLKREDNASDYITWSIAPDGYAYLQAWRVKKYPRFYKPQEGLNHAAK